VFDISKAKELRGNSEENFCECCGNIVFTEQVTEQAKYSMCSKPKDLADLGTGFSLFYSYTMKLIILLLILSLGISVPCLVLAQKEYSNNK